MSLWASLRSVNVGEPRVVTPVTAIPVGASLLAGPPIWALERIDVELRGDQADGGSSPRPDRVQTPSSVIPRQPAGVATEAAPRSTSR